MFLTKYKCEAIAKTIPLINAQGFGINTDARLSVITGFAFWVAKKTFCYKMKAHDHIGYIFQRLYICMVALVMVCGGNAEKITFFEHSNWQGMFYNLFGSNYYFSNSIQ